MSRVDLHPEDLLDREARGELSRADGARLEEHLMACAVCRFERLARADFARDAEQAGELPDMQRLLSAALVPEVTLGSVTSPTPRRARRLRLVLVAAAVMTVAGISMAAVALSDRRAHVVHGLPVAETAAAAQRPLVPLAPPQASVNAIATPGEIGTATAVELVVPAVPAPIDPPAAPPKASPVRPDAAAIFATATTARRSGDWQSASTLYRRLIDRYPASPEAHESAAVLGRMLLDRGDAGAAVAYFDSYLRAGGVLREDVMLGRAIALQRVGRTDDEAGAWSSLLRAYPSSVHAERARLRLAELRKL